MNGNKFYKPPLLNSLILENRTITPFQFNAKYLCKDCRLQKICVSFNCMGRGTYYSFFLSNRITTTKFTIHTLYNIQNKVTELLNFIRATISFRAIENISLFIQCFHKTHKITLKPSKCLTSFIVIHSKLKFVKFTMEIRKQEIVMSKMENLKRRISKWLIYRKDSE